MHSSFQTVYKCITDFMYLNIYFQPVFIIFTNVLFYTNLQILLFISSYIATFVDPKSYIFTMFIFTFERFFIFVVLFVKQVEILLRARRNEKELKVKPATSFKYFQYLLTKKIKTKFKTEKM